MTYVRGTSDLQTLRARVTRLEQANRTLAQEKRALVVTHTRERKAWAKQAGERVRLLEEARTKADKLITDAYAKAKVIVTDAEQQAGYIRERAYDWGRAAADRDYVSKQVKQADERRARETIVGRAA